MIQLHWIYNIKNAFRLEELFEWHFPKHLLVIPAIFDAIIPWCNKNRKRYDLETPKQLWCSVKDKNCYYHSRFSCLVTSAKIHWATYLEQACFLISQNRSNCFFCAFGGLAKLIRTFLFTKHCKVCLNKTAFVQYKNSISKAYSMTYFAIKREKT